jgi:hypothetical protein
MTSPNLPCSLASRSLLDARCPSPEMETEPGKNGTKETSSNKLTTERKVSFNKLVFIRETLHANDFSPEEKSRVWYQKSEIELIKEDIQFTLGLIMQGRLKKDTDVHCARGLEFRAGIGAKKRQENKLRALTAVLDEQDIQFDLGVFNQVAIAEVYRHISVKCQRAAMERGKWDRNQAYSSADCPTYISRESLTEKKDVTRKRLHNFLKLRTIARRGKSEEKASER